MLSLLWSSPLIVISGPPGDKAILPIRNGESRTKNWEPRMSTLLPTHSSLLSSHSSLLLTFSIHGGSHDEFHRPLVYDVRRHGTDAARRRGRGDLWPRGRAPWDRDRRQVELPIRGTGRGGSGLV